MLEKIEKVLDLLHAALTLYIDEHGGKTTAAPAAEKVTKTRVKKAAAKPCPSCDGGHDGSPHPHQQHADSPFAPAPAAAPAKLSPEDEIEAGRRGQEVMGLFIRRYLKASPTGLERAKKIINDTLGLPRVPATAWKLEDFKPEDWLALTPKFEAELDKADPK